jgi:hypothetical protein
MVPPVRLLEEKDFCTRRSKQEFCLWKRVFSDMTRHIETQQGVLTQPPTTSAEVAALLLVGRGALPNEGRGKSKRDLSLSRVRALMDSRKKRQRR